MCGECCSFDQCVSSEEHFLYRYNFRNQTHEKQYYPYMKEEILDYDACCYIHKVWLRCINSLRDTWCIACYNCICDDHNFEHLPQQPLILNVKFEPYR